MTANDYYTGAQNFPPHPQGNQAPPPYNANYGQAQQPSPRPSPQPPMRGDYHPPSEPGAAWAPWQQSYNSHHHPSQHYYGSPHQYPPQQQQQLQPYPQNHSYSQPPPNQANGYHQQQNAYPPPQQSQQLQPYPPHQQEPFYDDRPHKHHHHQKHSKKKSHESRDSFLGAGAGGIIGDVLLGPGVGTLGGAVIGALTGNAHAKNKNRSGSRDSRRSRRSRSGSWEER